MSPTRLWFGLGTGRCGTNSLAHLLDSQPGATVTHETVPVLPWTLDRAAIDARIAALRARGSRFAGDVALSYLPYAEYLLDEHPDTRLLVLRRDRDETVQSYERLAGGRNHFARHTADSWRADPQWDPCYPDYDEPNLRCALIRYWNEYSERAEDLAASHPTRVKVADVPEALSTASGVRDLLTYLGVPPGEQIVRTDIHRNRGPDMAARVKRTIAHRLRRHARDDEQ